MTDVARARAPAAHRVQTPLSRAAHLPGHIYNSPAIYALEKERIFMKDWLCVGRTEEIANPGDYMTFRIVDEPIVVTRNGAGAIGAFANVCAHRGVEVAAGQGNTKEFMCPYHGWLYDLDGRLVGAPYMKEAAGFDPARCRLKPLKSGVWQGWVFVNFDDGAMPLADYVADWERELGFLHMERCRLADKLVFDIQCNWKFAIENLVDIYHVKSVHATTFGAHVDPEKYEWSFWPRGCSTVFYPARPHTDTAEPLFAMNPTVADCGLTFGVTGFLAPNFHLYGRCENFRPCIEWPLGVDRVRLTYYNLFPAEFHTRPDFADGVARYRRYYSRAVEEDRGMMESLQRGMASRYFEPGRLSRFENAIHHQLKYYVGRMGDALDAA